jgi:hypothetical protein
MTIQEAIATAAGCLRLGGHPDVVMLAILNSDFTPEQSKLILKWAQQEVEKEHE